MKTCKVAGCERPRATGAYMCTEHLSEKRRCEARVVLRDEQDQPLLTAEGAERTRQCKRAARQGTTLCATHSGPKGAAMAQHTAALTAMQKFVKPYSGDLDPFKAFENEYRRTYGRIQWLEEQIGGLQDEQDLIWGLSKEEQVGASEFSGTNRTYEARIHVFEDMLRWERKHLLELTKLWVKAGLEEQKLVIMRGYMEFTYNKVLEAARVLGHDPNDPDVRERLARLFIKDQPALGPGK